jgi:hypothetical protein
MMADNTFFDTKLLDEKNIIDLTDKTIVTRLNGNLILLQVKDDEIIISPVGEEHDLYVDRIIGGRTLKVVSSKKEALSVFAERCT